MQLSNNEVTELYRTQTSSDNDFIYSKLLSPLSCTLLVLLTLHVSQTIHPCLHKLNFISVSPKV